ncbi:hypothetical protein AMECASPLE_016861 [Ameca splendens]|uniref:TIR domain-containing protein n=1 Tax=Ameca splendens TaxID=208324 RepID=A0ABV0ZB39_9TELE
MLMFSQKDHQICSQSSVLCKRYKLNIMVPRLIVFMEPGYIRSKWAIFEFKLRGGAVGNIVALQQEVPGFDSWPRIFLHGVCMFSPGTLASSHSPKTSLLG